MAGGIYVVVAMVGLVFAVISITGYFTDNKIQD